jgi:hypothetical protein
MLFMLFMVKISFLRELAVLFFRRVAKSIAPEEGVSNL